MAENTEIIRQRLFKTENYLGDFDPNKQGGYDQLDQCSLFGCVWESKIDDNESAPATWDGGDVITPNTQDWRQVSGDYEAWLLNKDKPATTGTTGAHPFNGMGRVVLRKNMVNVGTEADPEYVNTLTQDMFYKGEVGSRVPNTNTIFIIQYDYDLNGATIIIPANCILEFDGGSLSNGNIRLDVYGLVITGDTKFLSSQDKVEFTSNICNLKLMHDVSLFFGRNGVTENIRYVNIESNRNALIDISAYDSVVANFNNCRIRKSENPIFFILSENGDAKKSSFVNCDFICEETFDEKTDVKCIIVIGTNAPNDVSLYDYSVPRYTAEFGNCYFDNVGLSCDAEIHNCNFNVGYNNLYNNEVFHGAGSIRNCTFFSTHDLVYDSNMHDLIDTFFASTILIENCTFKDSLVCSNVITIKQHYGRESDPADGKPARVDLGYNIIGNRFMQKTGQSVWIYTGTDTTVDVDNIYNIKRVNFKDNTIHLNNRACLNIDSARAINIVNNNIIIDDVNTPNTSIFAYVSNSRDISIIGNNVLYNRTANDNEMYKIKFIAFTASYSYNVIVRDNNIIGCIVSGIMSLRGNIVIENNYSGGSFNLWGVNQEVDLTSVNGNFVIKNNSYYDVSVNGVYNCDFWSASYGSPRSVLMPLYKGAKRFDVLYLKEMIYNGQKWVGHDGYSVVAKMGNTRPTGGTTPNTLKGSDVGYPFFDTTVGVEKMIYAKSINETTGDVVWVDATGTPV